MSLCQATALRVKYRDLSGGGPDAKMNVRVENCGVHRKNRCGVYPAGIRCQELCIQAIGEGFLKEEFTDRLVAVQEMPAHEALQRMYCCKFKTGSQYNREASSKDKLLQTCFREPHGNVQHNLLSHCHMALVILAFMTKATWDLEPLKKMGKTIKFCDEQGRLSLTAVAATATGKELLEVSNGNVECEVLSWKMDIEEPTAAAIISASLNKCNSLAMKATEWAALYTLRGGIIAAAGALGERVAFKSVLEATRMDLDSAANDPDIRQLVDFLVNIGVTTNDYFDDLAAFQQKFINSNRRQMRFAGFGVVNMIAAQFPRTKIAIIKRAYRKKPGDTNDPWCSNPEDTWTTVAEPILQSAEDLLLYMHEDEQIRQKLDQTAVAAGTSSDFLLCPERCAEWRNHAPTSEETMHPFWAVRRMGAAEWALWREKTIGEAESVPDFNCAIVNKVHTVVDIATVGDQNLTSTRLILSLIHI